MDPPRASRTKKRDKQVVGYRVHLSRKGILRGLNLIPKEDRTLHLCINYRALNKVTVCNNYPLLIISDRFNKLRITKYFTKLDRWSRYYQVRIVEGDEPKTTCMTRYEPFKFLIIPLRHALSMPTRG